jgi:FKBP-type peptidyl-prolyl cis-trans isomerase 2
MISSGRNDSAVNGPLRIRVGEWEALPGLGEKLVGLQPGDERLIRLSPSEGFGDWDPNVVLTVEKSRILGDVPVENGTTLRFETRDGASAACRLYHIEEDRVAFVRIRRVVPPRRLKVGTAH